MKLTIVIRRSVSRLEMERKTEKQLLYNKGRRGKKWQGLESSEKYIGLAIKGGINRWNENKQKQRMNGQLKNTTNTGSNGSYWDCDRRVNSKWQDGTASPHGTRCSKCSTPVPGLLDKKEGRRLHHSLTKRWHLLPPFLSNESGIVLRFLVRETPSLEETGSITWWKSHKRWNMNWKLCKGKFSVF
jgi:hypothetical protein